MHYNDNNYYNEREIKFKYHKLALVTIVCND